MSRDQLIQILQRILFPFSCLTIIYLLIKDAAGVDTPLPDALEIMLGTGAVGYLTNWLAITMLFRPYERKPWLLFWKQGLIPASKQDIAYNIGQQVANELIRPKDIVEEINLAIGKLLDDREMRDDIRYSLGPILREQIPQSAGTLAPKLLTLLRIGASEMLKPESMLPIVDKTVKPWLSNKQNRKDFLDWITPILKEEGVPAIVSGIEEHIEKKKAEGLGSKLLIAAGQFLGAINIDEIRSELETTLESKEFRDSLCEYIAKIPSLLRDKYSEKSTGNIDAILKELQSRASDALASEAPRFLEEHLPSIANELLDNNALWEWFSHDMLPNAKPHIQMYVESDKFMKIVRENIDIAGRVESSMSKMDIKALHKMVNSVADDQLGAIQVLGYFLGVVIGTILPHLIFSELERIENSNLGKIPVAFDAFRLFHPGSDQSHL